MNIETNRLNTFTNWPVSAPVDPIRIAKAGLFYTGEGTEVQCFSCGGKISDWNYGDQVMWRHRRMEPNCSFVVNPQLSGNVPLVLGRECPPAVSNALVSIPDRPQDPVVPNHDYRPTEEDEMYKSDALRLLSYINFNDDSVSREALVNAGFYHAGDGRLRCAWCGGELAPFRNFGQLGHPLEVHRMYFPACQHAAALESAQRASLAPSSPPPAYSPPVQAPPDISVAPQSSGAAHNARLLAAAAGGAGRALGVVASGARHGSHAALAVRLATYELWPANRKQAPRALAEAGFFYTGSEDQVRCFYCDGGLGMWEAGDVPWSEHAFWFPHCGYVLLVKGQQFVDTCRATMQRVRGIAARRRHHGVNFPLVSSQVEESMEGEAALAALGAGLDVARVRRAIVRRLRATGQPFTSSEQLIDAVLNEQLNEEAWSVTPQSQRLARDILAETLREIVPRTRAIPALRDSNDIRRSRSESPPHTSSPAPIRAPPPVLALPPPPTPAVTDAIRTEPCTSTNNDETSASDITLEEENRQLKEARLCKVCMDNEVSVVFLPCGHLVSCGRCGAALQACPLCRCGVRALVRAYLA